MAHRKSRGQDRDRHLLAAALVHQSSYDDVSIGVHVSLDDARRRVYLFAVGEVSYLQPNSQTNATGATFQDAHTLCGHNTQDRLELHRLCFCEATRYLRSP